MIAHLLAAIVGAAIAVAGAMKMVDRTRWMQDAAAQGVWKPVASVLPFVELVLGALLVVVPPSAVVLGSSTLLLLIFTAFLVAQIATKSAVPCACFGSRSRRAPSMRDVARNIAMMGLLFTSAVLS